MDQKKLRAWWWHQQGLDGRLCGQNAPALLSQTGWARSVGGSGPYLTLFARGQISREAADSAVAALEIHELPSARGCTYVLPACDFPLALAAAQPFEGEMKLAYKLGVTDKEVAKLRDAVLGALEKGPLDPDAIREATGKASRSLGEEGKKKGLTTTLPLALGQLQVTGDIRRVSMNGRIDQQRYKYCLWKPNPLKNFKMPPEEVATELGRRFFQWIGPATLAEFQWFSALGVKAAKAALEPLKLEPTGKDADLLMLPADRERFESFRVPKEAQYRLVALADGITLLKRNSQALTDPDDQKHAVFRQKAYAGETLADLPSNGIMDRGRLGGLWEYDTTAQQIAWVSFDGSNKELTKAIEETESYVRDQLGDARSFSLDSPKSRAPKIEALRKAGAGKK
jgi:hypothetical protein